jgi:hypothetical protein
MNNSIIKFLFLIQIFISTVVYSSELSLSCLKNESSSWYVVDEGNNLILVSEYFAGKVKVDLEDENFDTILLQNDLISMVKISYIRKSSEFEDYFSCNFTLKYDNESRKRFFFYFYFLLTVPIKSI